MCFSRKPNSFPKGAFTSDSPPCSLEPPWKNEVEQQYTSIIMDETRPSTSRQPSSIQTEGTYLQCSIPYPVLPDLKISTMSKSTQCKAPQAAPRQQFLNFLPKITSISRPDPKSVIYIHIQLDKLPIIALLDTGSSLTIVSKSIVDKLRATIFPSSVPRGITANGSHILFVGEIFVSLTIADSVTDITCLVAKDNNCSSDFILRNDTINTISDKIAIDYSTRQVFF